VVETGRELIEPDPEQPKWDERGYLISPRVDCLSV